MDPGLAAPRGALRCIRGTLGDKRRLPQPSLRANGSRECAPDDRLREAIHRAAERKSGFLRRCAPRNDVERATAHITTGASGSSFGPAPVFGKCAANNRDTASMPLRVPAVKLPDLKS